MAMIRPNIVSHITEYIPFDSSHEPSSSASSLNRRSISDDLPKTTYKASNTFSEVVHNNMNTSRSLQ
jgi:hypothetical protein